MRKIKYILLSVLLCLFISQTAFATEANFGQVLSDIYRSKTVSDISLVFEDDIIDLKDNNVICVYELSGDTLYAGLDKLMNETPSNIFVSGANIDIKSTLGNSAQKSIEKITINNTLLLPESIYTLAINDKYDSCFEGENIVATYTSNDALLREYINSFSIYEQSAKEASSDDENNASNIILRQSSTLVMALVVLFAALVVYFVVKRKQK